MPQKQFVVELLHLYVLLVGFYAAVQDIDFCFLLN